MPSNRTEKPLARLADLTPRQIVAELDRYIVGQAEAKKAVAIALRNRWRRQRAPESIREEIAPNNIILIGPTGVGKTEIARRLAKLASAPFIKVEASKFTEVGYVGRDVESMEKMGIIFLDEIDKIAGERSQMGGPDVSREGVQRDLLPIVEGSHVQTKYGMVKTDHVLFIAAGAFHVSKPSDLIPELQGRFPIRVELKPLTERDFVRIMTEPENALTKQYAALVESEGAKLQFGEDGIAEIARIAAAVNERMENIGARRLHTVMTTLLEDVLYDLPDAGDRQIVVNESTVRDRLRAIVEDEDLRKYIL